MLIEVQKLNLNLNLNASMPQRLNAALRTPQAQ